MTGTIVVHAEQPGLGRAGTFGVVVDGVKVGRVKQGESAQFPASAGAHLVRVTAKDRTRSNTVSVEVAEGRDCSVTARGTGLGVALVLPLLAGIAVPPVFAIAGILLLGAVFFAVPGLMFRVRADGAPETEGGVPHSARADTEDAEGAGLWWESDPALAKRFQKGSGS
ncbi:hypothetical protein [Streptomyces sp. TLI_171]|uniref:hypothetical protein n=1 Tax=Streptomyces sp. TLI_171 TaxID=1938859 RepID=UPI000C4AB14C|nr:hypothetical protein [Streptomyces sp. TLI_171]RKE05073.1 hypothetical protein BX266_7323 [Streptomyces sp. TLI_171]